MKIDPKAVPSFEHDGFEVFRPWRDCGASWNQVDPTVYGFQTREMNHDSEHVMLFKHLPPSLFHPGPDSGRLLRLWPVKVVGGHYQVLPHTRYELLKGNQLAWNATVAEVDAAFGDDVEQDRLRDLLRQATQVLAATGLPHAQQLAAEILAELGDPPKDATVSLRLEFKVREGVSEQALISEVLAALNNDTSFEDSVLAEHGAKDFAAFSLKDPQP